MDIQKTNIVEMAKLLKLMYRFEAMPIKILPTLITGIEKQNFKWNQKGYTLPKQSWTTSKKEEISNF